MIIGYARPFSSEEKLEAQAEALLQLKCQRVYEEAFSPSGERPQLLSLLKEVKAGDKIVILKLQVLADSLLQLMETLKEFDVRGLTLRSLEDGVDTEEDTPPSFFETAELLANFQRKAISQSTKTGLSKAKEKGTKMGRPRKPTEKISEAITMYRSGDYTFNEIKIRTNVGKTTIYRYLEKKDE